MPVRVLVTDYVWPSIEPERQVLAGIGAELIAAPNGDEDTLVSMSRDVDGILTCFAKVTENVVRAAERCIVIGRYGVGVDNIAVDTATELGIAVTYVPDYCVDEVSDHTMALLLAWNRRVVTLDRSVRTTGWGSVPLTMRMMRLRGKTLGIVGYGRIGQAVAAKAGAFGFRVLAHSPSIDAAAAQRQGVRPVDLPTLLRESDFVTLHAPMTPDTEGLIGRAELDLMKPDAFLLNCARGALIDEDALYDALTSGGIAGAGVDVLVDLAPPPDDRFFQLDNLLVTPHTAFFSQEATLELERRAAGEVASVLRGEMPDNLVNPAVLSHHNPRHSLSAA